MLLRNYSLILSRLVFVSGSFLGMGLAVSYIGTTPFLRWVFPLYLALGVGLACMLRWGPYVWIGVLIGGFLLRIIRFHPLAPAILGSVADVLAVLAAYILIKRGVFSTGSNIRSSLSVLWAGMIGGAVWGLTYTAAVNLPGAKLPYPYPLGLWTELLLTWTGSTIPLIVSAQLVLTYKDRSRIHNKSELLLLLSMMLGIIALVCLTPASFVLVLIPLTWSIVRFNRFISAAFLFMAVAGMTTGARLGLLEIGSMPLVLQELSLQAFNLVAIVLVLVFGSIVEDQRILTKKLEDALKRISLTLDQASLSALWQQGKRKRKEQ